MEHRISISITKLEVENFSEEESVYRKFKESYPYREYSDYLMYDKERHENGNITHYLKNHRIYKK